jgi:hypothetical protein
MKLVQRGIRYRDHRAMPNAIARCENPLLKTCQLPAQRTDRNAQLLLKSGPAHPPIQALRILAVLPTAKFLFSFNPC